MPEYQNPEKPKWAGVLEKLAFGSVATALVILAVSIIILGIVKIWAEIASTR